MILETIIEYATKAATIGSAIFVGYQAKMLKKDYNLKNDKFETEKAIELSKFYLDNILNCKIPYLRVIFKETGVQEIITCLKYNELKNFDKEELYELLTEEKVKELQNKLRNIDLKVLIKTSQLVNNHSLNQYYDNLNAIHLEDIVKKSSSPKDALEQIASEQIAATQENNKFKIKKNLIKKIKKDTDTYSYYKSKYKDEFISIIEDTLNLLEYFCMNFNMNIANEKVVYQSLHQTFLGVVKLMYFFIANNNSSGKDKYYTNIIKLYNQWSKRYFEQSQIEQQNKNSSVYETTSPKR